MVGFYIPKVLSLQLLILEVDVKNSSRRKILKNTNINKTPGSIKQIKMEHHKISANYIFTQNYLCIPSNSIFHSDCFDMKVKGASQLV